jgi:anti-sigma factor RsiW
MMRCTRTGWAEDFLDGLLPEAEAAEYQSHAATCPECRAELAAMRLVFAKLEALPVLDPGPSFTERVLDVVSPARIRRRWIRTVGWSYAGSLAASIAAGLLVAGSPASTQAFDVASAAASRHLVQLASFLFNALGFATLGIANGWGAMMELIQRIAPVPRALNSALQQPTIERSLWAAGVICIVMLVWLHRRERTESDTHPLAVLGVWS